MGRAIPPRGAPTLPALEVSRGHPKLTCCFARRSQSIHSDLGQLVIQNFLRLSALQPQRTLPSLAIPDVILAASATTRHTAPPSESSLTPKKYRLEVQRFQAGNGLSAQRVFEALVQGRSGGEFWLDSAMVSPACPATCPFGEEPS